MLHTQITRQEGWISFSSIKKAIKRILAESFINLYLIDKAGIPGKMI